MDQISFNIKYVGGSADRHFLPAHDGMKSLEGLSWSFGLLGHYFATGRIQKRGALDPRVQFYVRPLEQGSVVTQIFAELSKPENTFAATLVGGAVSSVVATAFIGFVKYSFQRVCGIFDEKSDGIDEFIKRIPSGDLEANLDAIEPSMSRAHAIIGRGVTHIQITSKTPIIRMDMKTKDYVDGNIKGDEDELVDVSVGAFNANTGNGSVFMIDTMKMTPFRIHRFAEERVRSILSSSLDRYVRGKRSTIKVRCEVIYSLDNRVKKLIIKDAEIVPPPIEF